MAMTPEKKTKNAVAAVLKAAGAYYFYPVTGGYGAGSGVPDIIVCYRGVFLGIECKAGRGKTTKLQDKHLEMIRGAGGLSMVVNETNIDDVKTALDRIETGEYK